MAASLKISVGGSGGDVGDDDIGVDGGDRKLWELGQSWWRWHSNPPTR